MKNYKYFYMQIYINIVWHYSQQVIKYRVLSLLLQLEFYFPFCFKKIINLLRQLWRNIIMLCSVENSKIDKYLSRKYLRNYLRLEFLTQFSKHLRNHGDLTIQNLFNGAFLRFREFILTLMWVKINSISLLIKHAIHLSSLSYVCCQQRKER